MALALLVAGCGDDGDETGSEAETEEPAEPEETETGNATEEETETDAEGDGEASDAFPERDLTVVLAVGPGGNIDTGARQLQPYLSEELGVNVVIENIEGGQQAVGAQHVADAEPDCYTILSHIFPNFVLGAWFQDDITYDPLEDFVGIHSVNWDPTIIRIRNDAPWSSLEELIEDARSRPGEIPLGVAGYNTQYISTVNFEQAHDVEFNKVLLGSAGDQRAALRAGDVEVITTGVYTSYDLADTSFVAALLLQEDEQNEWPDFTNDAPTVPEVTGEAPFALHTLVGYFAPRGCYDEHPDRYDRLVEAIGNATQNPEFIADLEELNEQDKLRPMAGEEYRQYLEEEVPYLEDFRDFVLDNNLLDG